MGNQIYEHRCRKCEQIRSQDTDGRNIQNDTNHKSGNRKYMNEAEFVKFDQLAREAGIPKEVYIRNLLNGLLLKPAPKEELVEVIRQLLRIGNNINQLSAAANRNGHMDTPLYKENYIELQKEINEIKGLIQDPIELKEEHPCR